MLHPCDTSVPSSDLTEVNLAGVYSFGRGLFKRGPMSPIKTSYRAYNRLVTDDFVISMPKAWEGALARVTPDFDGWFLSPVFPCFRANRERLEPRYLEWFCRRSQTWAGLLSKAHGIGARRESVSPEQFLSLTVPLPSVSEQRRIVARIEELAGKMVAVGAERVTAGESTDAFLRAAAADTFRSVEPHVDLGAGLFEVIYRYPTFFGITFVDDGVGFLRISNLTQAGWSIQFDAPRGFITRETSARFPQTVLETGDLVMAVRATIGKIAYVTERFAGFNINANLLRMKPNPARLDGRYFWHFMRHGDGHAQLQALATSTVKKTVTVPRLKTVRVPVPSLEVQRATVDWLDALQAKVDELKRLQAETQAELDALLPSILDRAFKGEL